MPTTDDLQKDVDYIMTVLNDVQVAMTNLASKAQMRQLTLLRQQDITDLLARVAALEAEVASLKQNL